MTGEDRRIGVLGAGAWGTALAVLLARKGHAVTLWSHDQAVASQVSDTGCSPYLEGVAIPDAVRIETDLAASVEEIETAGLAVVALAFDDQALGGAPRGFGFLVPRGTGPRILGCLWDSSIFPGRAPGGMALMRVMVGGAHDPGAVGMKEEELVSLVRRDLKTTMGVAVEPLFSRVYRWPLGIGQYTVGHQGRLHRIHSRIKGFPGLWIAGSSYFGISMNACIERAAEQADTILDLLKSSA